MNMLPLLLGFLAYQMFNKKSDKPAGINSLDLSSLLSNPETLGVLASLTKLGSNNADTTKALMEIISNPAIMSIFTGLLNNRTEKAPDIKDAPSQHDGLNVNKEAKFSDKAVNHFKPVETVAGAQISEKLYNLYDNWYIKK